MKIRKQFEIKGIKFDQKPINGYFNYKQAIEYAESVGKVLISKHEMELLLTLPRKHDSTSLYIAEQGIWLDDENRRIEFPRLGYYNNHLNQKRFIGKNIGGYYWLQNTNPNPTENQPYLCFNKDNRIRIFYSDSSYGQPILLKTP